MSGKIKVSELNRLHYKSLDLKALLIEKWQVVLLISLFWAGMIIGCIFINNETNELTEKIASVIEKGFSARSSYTSMQIFKNSLLTHSIFLILAYILGMSGIGYPFICLVPMICGVSNGMVSGYIYSSFGIKGFLYCLTTVYPGLLISLVALIIGSCECLQMSLQVFKILTDKNRISCENSAKKYGYQFIVLFGIVIVSAIVETLMCNIFLGKFNLF